MRVIDAPFMQTFMRWASEACARGWHERNGGNLSYRLGPQDLKALGEQPAPVGPWQPLSMSVPALAGDSLLITGQGSYMRNIALSPEDNTGIIIIDAAGRNFALVWGLAHSGRPSSELPTHLLCQAAQKSAAGGRGIYHAHPPNLIALTFVLPPDARRFTRELWNMMPECPMVFPEGLGLIPWRVPGGAHIAQESAKLMRKHNAIIWSRHGLFCAGRDFDETFGLMETVEKAAEIYVKVLAMGGKRRFAYARELKQLADQLKLPLNRDFL